MKRRLIKAQYPKITTEHTSVTFTVNGLEGNEAYKDDISELGITEMPKTRKILEKRLLEEELAMLENTHPPYDHPNPKCGK